MSSTTTTTLGPPPPHSTESKILSLVVAAVAGVALLAYLVWAAHKRHMENRGCPCQKTKRTLFEKQTTLIYSSWGWKLYVSGILGAGHNDSDRDEIAAAWTAKGIQRVVNMAGGDHGEEDEEVYNYMQHKLGDKLKYLTPCINGTFPNDANHTGHGNLLRFLEYDGSSESGSGDMDDSGNHFGKVHPAVTAAREGPTNVMEFIDEGRREGESVLVHCRQGRNRAVATVCCYLITKQGWSFRKAAKHVRALRGATLRAHNLSQCKPLANQWFAQQLAARAIEQHGKGSEKAEEHYLRTENIWPNTKWQTHTELKVNEDGEHCKKYTVGFDTRKLDFSWDCHTSNPGHHHHHP